MATNAIATNQSDADSIAARLKMVNGQLRTADVTDKALLEALMAVPRENFAASAFAKLAYLDQDIPSAGATSRKLLAPRTIARLLQAAEVKAGERALEVGGGAGYAAAVLSELGVSVVSLESDSGAVEAATRLLAGRNDAIVIQGDLAKGAPGKGPFDLIVLNGAFEASPVGLLDQLANGGRLVAVDASDGAPRAVLVEKNSVGTSSRWLFDASGDVLPGLARAPSFAF